MVLFGGKSVRRVIIASGKFGVVFIEHNACVYYNFSGIGRLISLVLEWTKNCCLEYEAIKTREDFQKFNSSS